MFPFGPPLVQQWDGGRTDNPFVDRTRRLQGIALEQKVDIQSCVDNPGDACNGTGAEAGSGFPNSHTTGMQFDRWHSNGLPDPHDISLPDRSSSFTQPHRSLGDARNAWTHTGMQGQFDRWHSNDLPDPHGISLPVRSSSFTQPHRSPSAASFVAAHHAHQFAGVRFADPTSHMQSAWPEHNNDSHQIFGTQSHSQQYQRKQQTQPAHPRQSMTTPAHTQSMPPARPQSGHYTMPPAQLPQEMRQPANLPLPPMPPSGVQRDGRKAIKIRTPDEVLSSDGVAEVHRALELDAFPIGPLQIDSDSLFGELKLISINPHVGGGSFGITRDGYDGFKDGTTKHGSRPRFSCSRKGKDRCLCSLAYEWTTDGWMGVKYHSAHERIDEANPPGPRVHAHNLEQSTIAVSTHTSGRAVPPVLHELGRQLAAVCTPIQVHEGLQKEAKRRGLDHKTWNYKDVLSAFPVDASSKDFDAEGLIERLEENKREKGLEYKATVDGSRHLDKLFVEIDEARKEWALGGKENVLLFDPTHSTNRYGLKLCFFVTVGGTGQTVVLAFALIKHENIADISWAFRKFAEIFRLLLRIGAWLLLTLPPDDHVAQLAAQGLLNNPTGRPTSSGRKKHVRLKPVAGPTGEKRKRRSEK